MPVYWGCTFTHNYPFLMDSTRLMLGELGMGLVDIDDTGCCPDPVYLKTCGEDLNLALSARNLALAEQSGQQFLVPCNGCYNVLSAAHKKLKDPNQRYKINKFLPEGMEYSGNTEPIHILQILASNLQNIKDRVKEPLELNVAVHYGCHSLYPEPAVDSDNPDEPASLDEIVESTGATSIDYEGKLDCCGVGIVAFNMKQSNKILGDKLLSIKENADCIVTSCPACFMRFDALPGPLKELATPVLHLSEFLCLAFGKTPEDLFLEGHMTDVSSVVRGLKFDDDELALVKKHFDYGLLSHHCGACSKECTAAVKSRDSAEPFDPMEVVDLLLGGKLKEVLESRDIWHCLQCGKCEDRCPNNSGFLEFFAKLRELAGEHQGSPKAIEDKLKTLQKTGFGMPKKIGIRKKMGIDPAKEIDATTIVEIIEKTKAEDEDAG